MRVLLDHCVPRGIRRHLAGHAVRTCYEQGWDTLKNGALLAAAEAGGFEVSLTVDQNLSYQQSMAGRRIAVVVLAAPSNKIDTLLPLVPRTLAALAAATPGSVTVIDFPPA